MDYLNKLIIDYPHLCSVSKNIKETFTVLKESIIRGGKVLLCGNGGSAADSEHIVGELMKGFRLKRELTFPQVKQIAKFYPEEADVIAKNLQQAIPAISLVSDISLSTAFSNDVNPAFVYAQQVFGIGQKNDILIVISTSGNSINVLNAAKVANTKGMKVVGLTGETGGELAKHCDVTIKVPASEAPEVQELHLPIYHCLCSMIEHELFSDGSDSYSQNSGSGNVSKIVFPSNIELIVFDFDGVFTNNKVYTSQDGKEMVICDRKDSLGIDFLRKANIPMFILSTETNSVVVARAKKMGLKVYGGCKNKEIFLREYLDENGMNSANVIYMGNDLNDIEVMKLVGFSVAPIDAHSKIKEISSLIVKKHGGDGAVRELCEYIIQRKGE